MFLGTPSSNGPGPDTASEDEDEEDVVDDSGLG